MDGTNGDDLTAYRPGRRALKELNVFSPLAELGFSKIQIRAMAAELGLECASKPALPCLATRFEYGTELTSAKIQKVADAEELLRTVLPQSTNIRLRMHGDVGRIEVPDINLAELLAKRGVIVEGLKKLGLHYMTSPVNSRH